MQTQSMRDKPGPGIRFALSPETQRFWNANFRCPYWEFRRRIREETLSNLQKVSGAKLIVGLDAFEREFPKMPNGSLIVPCDDDDFFAPSLREMLPDTLGVPGFVWNSWYFDYARFRPVLDNQLRTNCVGFRRAALMCPPNRRRRILAYHWETPRLPFVTLHNTPAVIHRHPASLLRIHQLASLKNSAFRQEIKQMKKTLDVPVRWFQPHYDRLRAFVIKQIR